MKGRYINCCLPLLFSLQIIYTNTKIPKPSGIYWHLLSPQKLSQIRILQQLKVRGPLAGVRTLASGPECARRQWLRGVALPLVICSQRNIEIETGEKLPSGPEEVLPPLAARNKPPPKQRGGGAGAGAGAGGGEGRGEARRAQRNAVFVSNLAFSTTAKARLWSVNLWLSALPSSSDAALTRGVLPPPS